MQLLKVCQEISVVILRSYRYFFFIFNDSLTLIYFSSLSVIYWVFQNPDNQIIGTVVEEDVGFGPENIGVPTEEIWTRVNQSLEAVDMVKYHKQFLNHPNY